MFYNEMFYIVSEFTESITLKCHSEKVNQLTINGMIKFI